MTCIRYVFLTHNTLSLTYSIQIAARPHPYGVRANDDVRAFILSRVQAIALTHPHITIDDDTLTNVSFSSGLASTGSGSAAYFEGTNILVKVDGSDPELSLAQGAVLFDAHYDSVSTTPGATDDGMGVASLIALLEYLAKNRLRRTAVFNINNGEEDGLFGAHA
jgi:Zn-dependent M28 family amino/carboxypeptidase